MNGLPEGESIRVCVCITVKTVLFFFFWTAKDNIIYMIIIVPEVLQGRYDKVSPKRQVHKQKMKGHKKQCPTLHITD